MYSNNRGFILVFTLMVFSIISVTTMLSIGLNYSNNSLFRLEYKEVKLKENALSGLEIASSNIVKEVKQAVETSENEEEFRKYFLGNDFNNNITDISKTEINNVSVNIPNKPAYDERGFLTFSMISSCKEDKYSKSMQVTVEIKNPFFEESTNKSDEEESINNKINEDLSKENIDCNSLITMYNYKEI